MSISDVFAILVVRDVMCYLIIQALFHMVLCHAGSLGVFSSYFVKFRLDAMVMPWSCLVMR